MCYPHSARERDLIAGFLSRTEHWIFDKPPAQYIYWLGKGIYLQENAFDVEKLDSSVINFWAIVWKRI